MASGYAVEIENSAAKAIQRLHRHDQRRILTAVAALADEPRPRGCEKMSGFDTTYRIRLGNYRVVYIVDDAARVITVTRVGHRREVYR
ncbi:type II toxin-antitoxin system RelE family toxin [Mycobacterium canetti]|uniref:type II toxin-antitoxin system RelE family toxin n=1 Tax=Mycobacterium canetti TaxID=78331 RepID=UPI0002A57442|nr:type II toxin-antitoxin system RelE/ParE family toxin [Mycobacterium canetti]CCK62345.1 Gp41 [Mycobacterium canettii CIPT 140070017]